MAAKDELGRRGEELAAAFLVRAGYSILERNWRCRQGEVDVIAFDGREIAFVEVKTRTSVLFGHPLEAITPQKLARLRRLAGTWCERHLDEQRELHPGVRVRSDSIRIDAIGIVAPAGQDPVIEHRRGVF